MAVKKKTSGKTSMYANKIKNLPKGVNAEDVMKNTSSNTGGRNWQMTKPGKVETTAKSQKEKYAEDRWGGTPFRKQTSEDVKTEADVVKYGSKTAYSGTQERSRVYESLMNKYYDLENQEMRARMSKDANASANYVAGKLAKEDSNRLRNAFVKSILPASSYDGSAAARYALRAQNDELDYLEEKYGTRDFMQLKKLINAQLRDASAALEASGYNFDRMTDYEQRQLDAAAREAERAENLQFADEHGVLSSLATIGAAPAQGLDYLAMLGQQVQNSFRDEDDWRPVDTSNMDVTNFVRDIRGRVGENIEENTELTYKGQNVARFLYDTAMSMGDSAATVMLAGPAASYLLGGAAAAQSAKDVLENGGSATQAALSGLSAGAFEMLFERYSIEKLLEPRSVTSVKRLITETMKQSGVEASEEMATEVSNILANALIMGNSSDFNQSVEFYMSEQGGSMSEKAAKKQAFYDCIQQVLWAGAGGALSGGVMGGGVNSANLYSNVQQIKNQYSEDPGAIVREALHVDPRNADALALQKAIEAGEKITPYQLTKLRGATVEIVDKRVEALEKAEKKLGNKQWVAENRKSERETALSLASEKYGEQSGAMREVYRLGDNQDVAQYDEAFSFAYKMGKENGNFDYVMDSPATAYLSETQRYMAYEAGRAAYDKANEGKAVSVDENTALDIQNIAKVSDGVITFNLADGTTIQSDNVAYASAADTQLYDSVRSMEVDAETANAIVDAFRTRSGITGGTFIRHVEDAYRYGKRGMKLSELAEQSESVKKVPLKVLQAVYNAGVKTGKAETKTAQNAVDELTTEETKHKSGGRVLYMNGENTSDFHEYISNSNKKLNKQQEAAVLMMEKLSESLGVNFYIYESYQDSSGRRVFSDRDGGVYPAPNGYYTMGTGEIAIDLNAGKGGKGLMLYAVSHELTHFIKSWSPAKYRILCDAIIEEYSRAGKSFTSMIEKQRKKARGNKKDLNFDELFDEAIADSMEAIMTDGDMSQFMNRVETKDHSLWQKVRDWLRNVVDSLRAVVDAYRGYKPDSAEGRFIQQAEGAIERLQPVFADALFDAGEHYQKAEKNTAEDGGVKYSIRDSNINRTMIEYGDYANENRQIKSTAEGIIKNKKTVVIEADRIAEHDSSVDWDNKKEVRRYLKNILKVFAGESVYFTQDGQAIEAYLTKDGINHSVTGDVSAETAAVFERIYDLIVNAEYSYSSENDEHSNINKKINGKIDWDCFVAVASVGTIDYPVVFKLRTLDVDLRSQIYSVAEKREIGVSHDGGQQKKLMDAQPNYGASPIYEDTLSQSEYSVKKFSDRDYMAAVNRGDMETAQRMVDEAAETAMSGSKLRTSGGKLRKVYHGTNTGDFTVFNPDYIGMSSGDDGFFGRGFYFAYSRGEASYYGARRIISAYLDLKNPFDFDKELQTYNGKKAQSGYAPDAVAIMNIADKFPEIAKKETIGVVKNGNEVEDISLFEFSSAFKKVIEHQKFDYQEVDGDWGKETLVTSDLHDVEYEYGGKKHSYKAYGFQKRFIGEVNSLDVAYEYLANSVYKYIDMPSRTRFILDNNREFTEELKRRGYDGTIQSEDGDEAVAFEPNQIKSADPITYDDNGDVIPLSKRFNVENEDIRFSDRDQNTERVNASLERQNKRLKEDVSYLRKLVRLQGKVTGGKLFERSGVEAAARRLMRTANAKGDARELSNILTSFYEYIAEGDELTAESVREAAQPVIDWLRENEREQSAKLDPRAEEILSIIKSRKIKFNDAQKKEATFLAGGWGLYRNGLLGNVFITDKADMSLDELWNDMARSYPDVFDASISDTEQVTELERVIYEMQNMRIQEEQYDEDLIEAELFNEIYESYWDAPTITTVADKYDAEIRELKRGHTAALAEMKAEIQKTTEEINSERDVLLEQVRQEERQKAWKNRKELAGQYEESRKKASENRAKTIERQRIRHNIQQLKKMLNQTNADKNVKEELKEFVWAALNASEVLFVQHYTNEDMIRNGIGTDLTETEEKHVNAAKKLIEQMDEMKGSGFRQSEYWKAQDKLRYHMGLIRDVFVRERSRILKTPVSNALQHLIDVYKRLETIDVSYLKTTYDERVYWELVAMREELDVAAVKDMSLQQLKDLNDMYLMVLNSVRNANKLFCEEKNATVTEYAKSAMAELGSQEKDNPLQRKWQGKLSKFAWNNLKPIYAFRRIGSDTMTSLYEKIRNGEDVWARDMLEAKQERDRLASKYGYSQWNMEEEFEFESATGKKFKLNLGQIMSVYAYSRRPSAEDHLRKGGIVIDESTEVKVKNKLGITETFNPMKATAYNLTDNTIVAMTRTLTEEQKAFVVEMQTFLSDNLGAKGNEISMKLYGIRQFGEKNYFPLKSASQYLAKKREQDGIPIKLKNSGFTKATTPHASNPIVLTPFMETWSDHVNEMSMYHGFTLPLEDFYKVYNFSMPNITETDSISINAMIQNAHGTGATVYIDQLLKDVNGDVVTDNRETFGKSMVARFKKAAVFTSMSVVVQQPSAVGRAFALVDPKYFKATVGLKEHKTLMEEMREFAPVTIIKEMGYFDTAIGMSARDYLMAENYDKGERFKGFLKDSKYRDEWLSKLPALADELTWCTIWDAVKRECISKDSKLVPNSEEHLMRAGERFTEVITRTQVYDSVLSRSANMRSKSTFMGMLTSFMAEPTTSINMLEDAIRAGKNGDKSAASRTFAAVFTSVLINSMLSSIVYAMRDDDEDETFLEKYASSFATELIDGLNPMTYVPVLRDIWSLALGYDIERADMSLISDFFNTLTKIKTTLNKDTRGMTEDELAEYEKEVSEALWQLTDSMASLLGISWKNMRRDMLAVWNLKDTIAADITKRDTTMKTFTDKLMEGFWGAVPELLRPDSKTKKEMLLEAYMENDAEQKRRLVASYDSEKDALTALKNAIKEAYKEGEIQKTDAVSMLKKHVGLSEKETESTINEWSCVVVTGIEYSDIKEEYLEGNITDKRAEEMRMKYGGYTAKEAAETVNEWRFEKKWGFAYGSRVDAYIEGRVTENQLRQILIDHGAMSEVEADNYMRAYNWMKKNPGYDLSVSYALAYTKDVETLGVSAERAGINPNTFVEYKELASECKGVDIDGDGQADRNSKKNQILAVIDDLPISNYQKDVLYYMNGWSRSNLRKAPWH